MKKLSKKWTLGISLIIIFILIIILITFYIEDKKVKDSVNNIGNSALNFLNGIDKAQSHLNEFSYNNKTGEVEYKPSNITLETYNIIKEGMTQEEVISVLGEYENKQEGEDTYILEWGNSYSPVYGGYWIQIIFNENKKVSSKYQLGLK